MAFMEYQLSTYQKHFQIREQDFGQRWLTKRAKKQNSLTLLEEEIHSLRRRLEQMVFDGEEMTSDSVVELSTMLDQKINEYMTSWEEKSVKTDFSRDYRWIQITNGGTSQHESEMAIGYDARAYGDAYGLRRAEAGCIYIYNGI